jgi:hypothetical protein
MDVGDGVFAWRAAPHSEIVALAEVDAAPEWQEDEEVYRYGLCYRTEVFPDPLRKADLLDDPVVSGAVFLKHGVASGIVALTRGEARRMWELLAARVGADELPAWFDEGVGH